MRSLVLKECTQTEITFASSKRSYQRKTYFQAKEACEREGKYLLAINTPQLLKAVNDYTKDNGMYWKIFAGFLSFSAFSDYDEFETWSDGTRHDPQTDSRLFRSYFRHIGCTVAIFYANQLLRWTDCIDNGDYACASKTTRFEVDKIPSDIGRKVRSDQVWTESFVRPLIINECEERVITFHDEKKRLSNAEESCEMKGKQLLIIDNQRTMQQVSQFLKEEDTQNKYSRMHAGYRVDLASGGSNNTCQSSATISFDLSHPRVSLDGCYTPASHACFTTNTTFHAQKADFVTPRELKENWLPPLVIDACDRSEITFHAGPSTFDEASSSCVSQNKLLLDVKDEDTMRAVVRHLGSMPGHYVMFTGYSRHGAYREWSDGSVIESPLDHLFTDRNNNNSSSFSFFGLTDEDCWLGVIRGGGMEEKGEYVGCDTLAGYACVDTTQTNRLVDSNRHHIDETSSDAVVLEKCERSEINFNFRRMTYEEAVTKCESRHSRMIALNTPQLRHQVATHVTENTDVNIPTTLFTGLEHKVRTMRADESATDELSASTVEVMKINSTGFVLESVSHLSEASYACINITNHFNAFLPNITALPSTLVRSSPSLALLQSSEMPSSSYNCRHMGLFVIALLLLVHATKRMFCGFVSRKSKK